MSFVANFKPISFNNFDDALKLVDLRNSVAVGSKKNQIVTIFSDSVNSVHHVFDMAGSAHIIEDKYFRGFRVLDIPLNTSRFSGIVLFSKECVEIEKRQGLERFHHDKYCKDMYYRQIEVKNDSLTKREVSAFEYIAFNEINTFGVPVVLSFLDDLVEREKKSNQNLACFMVYLKDKDMYSVHQNLEDVYNYLSHLYKPINKFYSKSEWDKLLDSIVLTLVISPSYLAKMLNIKDITNDISKSRGLINLDLPSREILYARNIRLDFSLMMYCGDNDVEGVEL